MTYKLLAVAQIMAHGTMVAALVFFLIALATGSH